MKLDNKMSLFKVIIDRKYKDTLLLYLAKFKTAHIKSRIEYDVKKSTEEEELFKEKIKNLRLNLETLFKKLEINESDFNGLRVKEDDKLKYIAKDSHELINYLLEEINFYTNRFNELEKYIINTKIELEKISNLNNTYQFLEKFGLTRDNYNYLSQFNFKAYTTFSKNIAILDSLFEFSELPNIIQIQPISSDRTAFFIIYPKDEESIFKDKLNVIHAEEVPILKKYLTSKGINFDRINKEIELLENYLLKYEKEIKGIKEHNLLKFAAISEATSNLEEYNWADNQFEELSLNKLSYKFFVIQAKKEEIKQKLNEVFHDKIKIEITNIGKRGELIKDKTIKKSSIKKIKNEDSTSGLKENWETLREETPTMMTHNRIIRPFETLTKMYGTPSYSEIDPTPFLFITFPLLFGIMFGDIGHGLVLVISGIIGSLFFRKRGRDFHNFCWIIFWCGLWAMLGGLLYGEFFGSNDILGYHLEPIPIPIPFIGTITLYDPLDNVLTILILTLFIGILHINLGWILQFINYWKQSKKYKAFSESLMKILFLDGFIFLLIRWGLNLNSWFAAPLPPILFPLIPGLLLVILKPIGKMIGVSYLKKSSYAQLIGEGSMGTFETVLSVPSNVLSYIRLLALALAHISLMLAITAMVSTIPGEGIFIQILIMLSIILGNVVVILLEGVLVFLNALRLHFYEFFFKFFEGSGTEFIPFILKDNFSEIIFKIEAEKDIISTEIEKEIETEKTKEIIEKARDFIYNKFF
ncbi:MAG: V-type ATP synthase subunit I [Promethearchaeota archaeon]